MIVLARERFGRRQIRPAMQQEAWMQSRDASLKSFLDMLVTVVNVDDDLGFWRLFLPRSGTIGRTARNLRPHPVVSNIRNLATRGHAAAESLGGPGEDVRIKR